MADIVLRAAVTAVQQGGYNLHQALDTLPVPVYVANRRGVIIYYNRACVGFTGYIPRARRDRWCVTWKLYTEAGVVLPHDQSPMAVAIRERRVVRGIKAIAERPNGTRVKFLPYPTPLFDADGNFHCAVNMFIDLAEPSEFQHGRRWGATTAARMTVPVIIERDTSHQIDRIDTCMKCVQTKSWKMRP
jgi:PAS domain-containing protein